MIGHRGAPFKAPENTIASFESAVRSGAAAVECDVHLSRDGIVMVIHDETLDRTTGRLGRVDQTTRTEMPEIPTLTDLLRVTREVVTIIELKHGADLEPAVVSCVEDARAEPRVIYFSFDIDRLRRVRSLVPTAFVTWLSRDHVSDPPPDVDAIGVHWQSINRQVVAASRFVFAWTVPVGDDARRLVDLGVRFLVTDEPERMSAFLTRS